jgi:integrase
LIAILTGLRRNEVATLKWSDIDFEKSIIHLRAEVTKSHKRREVPVPDYLKSHLLEIRKQNPFAENILCEWKTFNGLRFAWQRLRNSLSFKTLPNGSLLHFHDLRHVYAQSMRDAGVSLQDIQAFLGHSSVTVTESRYAQFGGRDAVNKANKIAEIIPLRSAV